MRFLFQVLVCCAVSFQVTLAHEVAMSGPAEVEVEVEETRGENTDDEEQYSYGGRDFDRIPDADSFRDQPGLVGRVSAIVRRDLFGWHCRFLL